MNKVILMGRLTRDPEVRNAQGANGLAVARWTLAVDRRFKRDNEPSADFINCVAFGKTAEHAEKYYKQGTKIAVCGRIQTGSFTDKDGVKRYTTDVVVEESEFAESKSNGGSSDSAATQTASKPATKPAPSSTDGFANIPDGVDEELPFN